MFEFLALLCAGVFFGAAVYVSIVQHPAALRVGGALAARFFPPMYQRAAPMQASLAILGSVSGLVAGDTVLTVQLGDAIDAGLSETVLALYAALRHAAPDGLR